MPAGYELHHGDCLDVMRGMADNSVDLIATDPPYFKVKGEAWDSQWDTPAKFLAWIGTLADEWQRIIKPNGSLYVFASPKMSARVEVEIGRRFEIINNIVWQKETDRGKHAAACKEALRGYFPNTERLIFAEHYGSDGYAKGEAGYATKCDELRGFVFEPIRAYLADERDRAGVANSQINDAWCQLKSVNSTSQTQKWFSSSCFNPPTREAYQWLRETFARLNHGGEYLRKDYEELRKDYEELRKDYEELRQQYEDLRRPFAVTADVPYTDVWTFPTVGYYKGKHVCEKPLAMMRHIVAASSRPGAVVLDCFMGSGVTGEACRQLGREFIGIDSDAHWVEQARARVEAARPDAQLCANVNTSVQVYTSSPARKRKITDQLDIFGVL